MDKKTVVCGFGCASVFILPTIVMLAIRLSGIYPIMWEMVFLPLGFIVGFSAVGFGAVCFATLATGFIVKYLDKD